MKIAVTGGTGFIGGHLIRALTDCEHEVLLISRSRQNGRQPLVSTATWDELAADPGKLEGFGAIVNLAGESINQRWTPQAKKRIVQSRLSAAENIARAVAQLHNKPEVVINGSGMSIYGTSENETFDEGSPHRQTDFLSGVVRQWEEAADFIEGVRLVKLRIGIVLGGDGGALPKMMLPYRLGVGGKIGSGRQWLSWIHIADMVGAILFCIEHQSMKGPVNCTAPNPATNESFGREIGKALKRPHWMPVPSVAFRAAFGEMAVLLLEGQKVLPKKLTDAGYLFRFPEVDAALADIVKKGGLRT